MRRAGLRLADGDAYELIGGKTAAQEAEYCGDGDHEQQRDAELGHDPEDPPEHHVVANGPDVWIEGPRTHVADTNYDGE